VIVLNNDFSLYISLYLLMRAAHWCQKRIRLMIDKIVNFLVNELNNCFVNLIS